MNLDPSKHPYSIDVSANNKYENSLALSGSQIFNMFFENTSFYEFKKNGTSIKHSLLTEWERI